ncbi:homoserine o-acetyltransferase [Plakobranchus ocellatus]|uniref:Homoserine o-acetyltransferase n=1 Tax=Plakobranchus ocellatus TaxID=259542 RepID=A0AAV3Z0L4_9GAST|nr:homoserine o-acetyltransferase [Plakobranchus ocellatus]
MKHSFAPALSAFTHWPRREQHNLRNSAAMSDGNKQTEEDGSVVRKITGFSSKLHESATSLTFFSSLARKFSKKPFSVLSSPCNHRAFSSSSPTYQESDRHEPIQRVVQEPMPQIGSPDVDVFEKSLSEPPQPFKGLETDFPCLSRVKDAGPEPVYQKVTSGYSLFCSEEPFHLYLNNGVLPQLEVAYETWGTLNSDKSNAVVILAGLSASSHARSSVNNLRPGWWEQFVGPGCAVDTSKFFVICPNNFGGCYGSSGPSSINSITGKPYGTTFPIICVEDMTRAIFLLLDHLGIDKLYGTVGSSLGGMLSLQSAASFPDRVGRLISISSCAQSHPSSIAMRYLQRKCIMVDPNWHKGHYYDKTYPKIGMKLAREIATITYRSGPEWGIRFGRGLINENEPVSLCPTFLIESYLEHQGESFSTLYDPNSLLYISKAMDMYDMAEGYNSLEEGLSRIKCPVMVVGVQTDVLFPIWQQRQLAKALQDSGNEQVTFYELNSIYGHDTFLLDLNGVGAAVKGFLETDQKNVGIITKHKLNKEKKEKYQACPIE